MMAEQKTPEISSNRKSNESASSFMWMGRTSPNLEQQENNPVILKNLRHVRIPMLPNIPPVQSNRKDTVPPLAVKRPQIISVFNNKGGVGKTTTTAGLGWKLASRGWKVLLVDGDPQCNLTGFLVDPGFELYKRADAPKRRKRSKNELSQIRTLQRMVSGDTTDDGFDALGTFYDRFKECTITYAVAPVLNKKEADNRKFQSANCFQVSRRKELLPNGHDLKQTVREDSKMEVPESLYLLAGHPSFGKLDTYVTLDCENPTTHNNFDAIGCFYELLIRTGEEQNFDFIIVDMSPSTNTINKLFVMSSNFLLVPCSPDYFSLMAVTKMSELLIEWDEWMQESAGRCKGRTNFRIPMHKPIFLGCTIQLFTLSTSNSRRPAEGFAKWVTKIQNTINRSYCGW